MQAAPGIKLNEIKYALPKSEIVKIEVFNNLGQKVKTLIDQHMNAGW